MADKNTMGLTLGIDGEKQFKEALERINLGLGMSTANLTKLTAEYELNNSSIAKGTAVTEAYMDHISAQREKVDELKKIVEMYTKELGAGSNATMYWQGVLNKTEGDLAKLKKELVEHHEKTKKSTIQTEEFKNELQKLSDSIELNDMKTALLTAEYGENANSVEALKKKNDILNDSIEKQREKVSQLEKALNEANKRYGEGNIKTAEYEKRLISAKTQLANMDKALEDNKQKMSESTVTTSAFNDILSKVSDMTGIKLPADLISFSGAAAGVATGIGAAFTTALAVIDKTHKSIMEAVDNVKKLSIEANRAGISEQEMAALDYAARITNTTSSALIDAFTKVTELMGEAESGGKDALWVFKSLGIDIRNEFTGELKNAKDLFFEIAEQLGQIDDDTFRNNRAIEIFGEKAKDLYGIFKDSAYDMKYAINEFNTDLARSPEFYERLNELGKDQVRIAEMIKKEWEQALISVDRLHNADLSFFERLDDISKVAGGLYKSIKYAIAPWSFSIDRNARGTDYFAGGTTWVGEEGPEIVELPRGTKIHPNERSQGIGGDTYVFNINPTNVKEFNDLVRIAENKRRSVRMGYTGR